MSRVVEWAWNHGDSPLLPQKLFDMLYGQEFLLFSPAASASVVCVVSKDSKYSTQSLYQQ